MAAYSFYDLSSRQVAVEQALESAGFVVTQTQPDAKRGVLCLAARDEREVQCLVRPERQGTWVELSLAWTGVPVELTLRPELAGEGFDKLLGMTVDLKVNDPAFDRRFVIEAAPAAIAPRMLGDLMRSALMAIPASDEGPVLRLGRGRLVVAWRGEPDREVVRDLAHAMALMAQHGDVMIEGMNDVPGLGPFRAGAGGDATVDPHARESARKGIASARRRAVAFISTAALAGAGFLAAVLAGARFT